MVYELVSESFILTIGIQMSTCNKRNTFQDSQRTLTSFLNFQFHDTHDVLYTLYTHMKYDKRCALLHTARLYID